MAWRCRKYSGNDNNGHASRSNQGHQLVGSCMFARRPWQDDIARTRVLGLILIQSIQAMKSAPGLINFASVSRQGDHDQSYSLLHLDGAGAPTFPGSRESFSTSKGLPTAYKQRISFSELRGSRCIEEVLYLRPSWLSSSDISRSKTASHALGRDRLESPKDPIPVSVYYAYRA